MVFVPNDVITSGCLLVAENGGGEIGDERFLNSGVSFWMQPFADEPKKEVQRRAVH